MDEKLKKAYRVRRLAYGMALILVVFKAVSFFNSPENNKAYLKSQIPIYILLVAICIPVFYFAWKFQKKSLSRPQNNTPTVNQPSAKDGPFTSNANQQIIKPSVVAPIPQQPNAANDYAPVQPVQSEPNPQQSEQNIDKLV